MSGIDRQPVGRWPTIGGASDEFGPDAFAMIRVLLVDDHPLVRDALAQLIGLEPDIEVTAVASTLAEARRRLADGSFDVAVIDLALPDGNGIELVREISARGEATRVLVLTGNEDQSILPQILAAGTTGILVKRAHPNEVLTAIRTVADGRSFLGVGVTASELGRVLAGAGTKAAAADKLSPREREVLIGVARGHTNQEIGAQLGISPKTIATYRARLSEKLDLEGRADLVRYALESGLLDEPV